MKFVILFLFLSFTLIGQDNNFRLSVGVEVAPILHTKEVRNLQSNSLNPNLLILVGGDNLKLIASIGNVSRFGFLSTSKWTYANAYYTVNTESDHENRIEHGAEIELGFNHNIRKRIRFHIGASIGLLHKGRESKLTLRPLVIGFTYKVI